MDGEPTRQKQGAGETTHCEHWMEVKTRLQQASPQGRTVKWPGIGRWHRVVHWLPGKPAEGQAPHGTLIRTVTGWGLGQVRRKVSHGSRVWGKQVLVRQVMCREQESSHLEQPDCTLFYMINIILGEFISLFLSFTLQANVLARVTLQEPVFWGAPTVTSHRPAPGPAAPLTSVTLWSISGQWSCLIYPNHVLIVSLYFIYCCCISL